MPLRDLAQSFKIQILYGTEESNIGENLNDCMCVLVARVRIAVRTNHFLPEGDAVCGFVHVHRSLSSLCRKYPVGDPRFYPVIIGILGGTRGREIF